MTTNSAQVAGSAYFPETTQLFAATAFEEIDRSLRRLAAHQDEWARLRISERIALVEGMRRGLYAVRSRWVAAELKSKELPPGSFGEAEEWTMLAAVFRGLSTIRRSLADIQARGRPRLAGRIKVRNDGQVVAPVLPASLSDRLLFRGTRAEVRMEPDVTAEAALVSMASAYREEGRRGRVAMVLGAGNASLLPACDMLHKLFVDLRVTVVKLNPVNAHLGPLMEEAFSVLVDRGFLAFVYGGKEVGSYLAIHPDVYELHMTGSDKTYEAIVFGRPRETRDARPKPVITKRFTGELGNISPVIIVPGAWQAREVAEQAKHISTWLVANAGFGCLTPRVIVQHRSWPRRQELLEAIGRRLRAYPTRKAYYPGAIHEHARCVSIHPEALQYGKPASGHLPWTVVPDIDPRQVDDICFRHEFFCGLMAETSIDAPDVPAFLERAVEFCNSVLWGTLNATLIIHPGSLREPGVAEAVERAIARLRYGTVSLNMLAFYSAYFMTAPWGGFPGHDIFDIQSGVGKTFNFLMFDRPEKSVVRAPFYRFDPITITTKRAPEFCKRLAEFEAYPRWWKLPALMVSGLRAVATSAA
ncbi:MAG TPA: aldehyde dehydrogenase family protein [Anaerolineales bacterium]|nr:aldehyde dehydrogenase family protein [Anaerolineales bacterium]